MSLKCRVTIRNMFKFHVDCILTFILSMKESYDIYLFSYFSPIDIKLFFMFECFKYLRLLSNMLLLIKLNFY